MRKCEFDRKGRSPSARTLSLIETLKLSRGNRNRILPWDVSLTARRSRARTIRTYHTYNTGVFLWGVVLQCPHQLSRFFFQFIPASPWIFPTLPGKNLFFSRHMIPAAGSLQKQAEERGEEAIIKFPPPPSSSGSDSLPLHRPSSGDDALRAVAPFQPNRPPPPSAPLPSDCQCCYNIPTRHHRRRHHAIISKWHC
jgi:hypothetical protein